MIGLDAIKKSLQKDGKYWIVFTGDSITSSEWVHPNWREIVEYVLKEELEKALDDWKVPSWGIRCFNFAYDGATTKDILEKIDDLLLVQPNLVISLMGGNDPVLGVTIEQCFENIKKISERLNTSGTKVVWCTSTPAGPKSKKNPEYEPYAKATMALNGGTLQLVDMFNIYKKFPTEKFFTFISEENPIEGIKGGEPDSQHPNQLGNAYIAKVILEEVFGIKFDPEKYIKDTLSGEKYPKY